jgi:sec-independent protein translocase protein TatB
MQMEDELRQVEQADRLKKIEAMEAAAPVTPALPETTAETSEAVDSPIAVETAESVTGFSSDEPAAEADVKPLPIAGSGEVTMMPPATGLPTPRNSSLSGLLRAIPAASTHIGAETNGTHPPVDAPIGAAEPAETRANAD